MQLLVLSGNSKYWGFLFIASLLEALWTLSLKFMRFNDLKKFIFENASFSGNGLQIMLPFAGYLLFGIGNVYFFSLATRQIPLALAFAVWTGTTLIIIKLTEVFFQQQKIAFTELFFILMILMGIVGLKYYGTANSN